jgi:hypothetical protein
VAWPCPLFDGRWAEAVVAADGQQRCTSVLLRWPTAEEAAEEEARLAMLFFTKEKR